MSAAAIGLLSLVFFTAFRLGAKLMGSEARRKEGHQRVETNDDDENEDDDDANREASPPGAQTLKNERDVAPHEALPRANSNKCSHRVHPNLADVELAPTSLVGQRVALSGLSVSPELNGREGNVVGLSREQDRFVVHLDDGPDDRVVALRLANIRSVS